MFRTEDFAPDLSAAAENANTGREPISRRIKALAIRHRAFDAAIETEASQVRPDHDLLLRLKRTRLRIRDEVVRLQALWKAQRA